MNPANEPDGGRQLIDEALRRASAATGLAFEDEGETDERPFEDGVQLFGRPDPVVIGWVARMSTPTSPARSPASEVAWLSVAAAGA